nr:unnamed protein product [Callosobruchus analis]
MYLVVYKRFEIPCFFSENYQLPEESSEDEITEVNSHPTTTENDYSTINNDNALNQNCEAETVSMAKSQKRKSIFQSLKAKRTCYK